MSLDSPAGASTYVPTQGNDAYAMQLAEEARRRAEQAAREAAERARRAAEAAREAAEKARIKAENARKAAEAAEAKAEKTKLQADQKAATEAREAASKAEVEAKHKEAVANLRDKEKTLADSKLDDIVKHRPANAPSDATVTARTEVAAAKKTLALYEPAAGQPRPTQAASARTDELLKKAQDAGKVVFDLQAKGRKPTQAQTDALNEAAQNWLDAAEHDMRTAGAAASARGEDPRKAINAEYERIMQGVKDGGVFDPKALRGLVDKPRDEVLAESPAMRQLRVERRNALTDGATQLKTARTDAKTADDAAAKAEKHAASFTHVSTDSQATAKAAADAEAKRLRAIADAADARLKQLQTLYEGKPNDSDPRLSVPGTVVADYDARVADLRVQELQAKYAAAKKANDSQALATLAPQLDAAIGLQTLARAANEASDAGMRLTNAEATQRNAKAQWEAAKGEQPQLKTVTRHTYGGGEHKRTIEPDGYDKTFWLDYNKKEDRERVRKIDGKYYLIEDQPLWFDDKKTELNPDAARLWQANEELAAAKTNLDQRNTALQSRTTELLGTGNGLPGKLDTGPWLANEKPIGDRLAAANTALATAQQNYTDGLQAGADPKKLAALEQALGAALQEQAAAQASDKALKAMQALADGRRRVAMGEKVDLEPLEDAAAKAFTGAMDAQPKLDPAREAEVRNKLLPDARKVLTEADAKVQAAKTALDQAAPEERAAKQKLLDEATAARNRIALQVDDHATTLGLIDAARAGLAAKWAYEHTQFVKPHDAMWADANGDGRAGSVYPANYDPTWNVLPGEVPEGAEVKKMCGRWYVVFEEDVKLPGVNDDEAHTRYVIKAGTYEMHPAAAKVWETTNPDRGIGGSELTRAEDARKNIELQLPRQTQPMLGPDGRPVPTLELTDELSPLKTQVQTQLSDATQRQQQAQAKIDLAGAHATPELKHQLAAAQDDIDIANSQLTAINAILEWQQANRNLRQFQADQRAGRNPVQPAGKSLQETADDLAAKAVNARAQWVTTRDKRAITAAEHQLGLARTAHDQWKAAHPQLVGSERSTQTWKNLQAAQAALDKGRRMQALDANTAAMTAQQQFIAANLDPSRVNDPHEMYRLFMKDPRVMAQSIINAHYVQHGAVPIEMDGRTRIANEVGVALGWQPSVDLGANTPARTEQLMRTQNLFGNLQGEQKEMHQATVDEIIELGGERARVTVLPVVYALDDDHGGIVKTALFKVETDDGYKLVDERGWSYDDVDDYRANNALAPEGVNLVMPENAEFTLQDDGNVKLFAGAARTETGFETFRREWHVDTVVGVVGVAAGVVVLIGSGGTATPLAALMVSGSSVLLTGSMAYGAYAAITDLHNLNAHGQSLNPITNERARMSEIALLGVALGGGSMGAAARTASAATRGAAATASTWGSASTVLGRGALVTGVAGGADQTRYLVANWEHMSGAERGEAILNLSMSGIDLMSPAIAARIRRPATVPGVEPAAVTQSSRQAAGDPAAPMGMRPAALSTGDPGSAAPHIAPAAATPGESGGPSAPRATGPASPAPAGTTAGAPPAAPAAPAAPAQTGAPPAAAPVPAARVDPVTLGRSIADPAGVTSGNEAAAPRPGAVRGEEGAGSRRTDDGNTEARDPHAQTRGAQARERSRGTQEVARARRPDLPAEVEAALARADDSRKAFGRADRALGGPKRRAGALKNELQEATRRQARLEVDAHEARRLAREAEARAERAGRDPQALALRQEADALHARADRIEGKALAARARLEGKVEALAEAEQAHAQASLRRATAQRQMVEDQLALARLADTRAAGDVHAATARATHARAAADDAQGPRAFTARTRAAVAERRAAAVGRTAEGIGARTAPLEHALGLFRLTELNEQQKLAALEADTSQAVRSFRNYLDEAATVAEAPRLRRVLDTDSADAAQADALARLRGAREARREARAVERRAEAEHGRLSQQAQESWLAHRHALQADPNLSLPQAQRRALVQEAADARLAERALAVARADRVHAEEVYAAVRLQQQRAFDAAKAVRSAAEQHDPSLRAASRAGDRLVAYDEASGALTRLLDRGPEKVPVSLHLRADGLTYGDAAKPAYPDLPANFWPRYRQGENGPEYVGENYQRRQRGDLPSQAVRKTVDRTILRLVEHLGVRGNAYEALTGNTLRPGDFLVDPLVVERAGIPGGLERVIGDVHAHDRGYDHRAANRGERLTLRDRLQEINAGWRPVERYFYALKPLSALQEASSQTSRILHGSIPQMSDCGLAHYSGIDAGGLTMKNGKRVDGEVAREFEGLWQSHLRARRQQAKALLDGDAEAAARAGAAAEKYLLSAARADLSMTGVDPSKTDAAAHARQMLLEHPGVFKFVGELTIKKEMVDVLLGDESFSIDAAAMADFLQFAHETGLGVLIHCDWGRHALDPHDGRPTGTRTAYEHFDQLIELVSRYPDANIVLAHTGIGRLVRPDTTPTTVRLAGGGEIVVPKHMANVHEALQRAPNLRFDISWNDVAEAYLSDPAMRSGLADFILLHQDRVLFGSDTVKPVNAAQYNQSLTTYLPLFSDIAMRSPEALWKLLRGNYDELMARTESSVRHWTARELQAGGRGDEVAAMDDMLASLGTRRTQMSAEARAHFDRWVEMLYGSSYEQAAGQYGLPPARAGAPVADRSVSAQIHAGYAPAREQHWVGDPNGRGSPRGHFDSVPRRILGGTAAMAGMTGAYAAGDGVLAMHPGDDAMLHATGFETRAAMGLVRGAYGDAVRLSWERMFEEGRVTHKELDRFMNRIRVNGKALGLSQDKLIEAARLTEQFRVDYAYLANKPLDPAHGWDEVQRFNAIMATVGQYQIGVDRALGMQASSIHALDPRVRTGQLFRAATALSYGLNVAYAWHAVRQGDMSVLQTLYTAGFGAGNAALMSNALAGLGSGLAKGNWEVRGPFRWTQPLGMSGLGGAGALWTLNDALRFFAQPSWLGAANTALGGAFTYAAGRQAVGDWRKTLGLPNTMPSHQSSTAYWLAAATAARVGLLYLEDDEARDEARALAWRLRENGAVPGAGALAALPPSLQQFAQLDPRLSGPGAQARAPSASVFLPADDKRQQERLDVTRLRPQLAPAAVTIDGREARTRTLWGVAQTHAQTLLAPPQQQAALAQGGDDAIALEALKRLVQINPEHGFRLELMDGRVTGVPGDPDTVHNGWQLKVDGMNA